MKTMKILPIIFALLIGFSAIGQEEEKEEMKTLFKQSSTDKITSGGYGSFSIGYSKIDSKDAMQFGGRVAWIANHKFAMGLAGFGFVNNIQKNYDADPSEYFLAGGYGGFFFEPILMPNKPVHISFPIIFGVGGVSAVEADNWEKSSHYDNNSYYYDTDAYLVFEPGIDIEFNIVKFFRVALGASYRLTNGVNLNYKYLDNNYTEHNIQIDKNALDSFTFNIGFKFGWF